MIDVINPSTSEVIKQLPEAEESSILNVITGARRAFDSGPWTRLSLAERKNYILKIHQGILDKAGELAQIESQNTGKPIKETTFMDVPSAAETFKYFAEHLEEFLKSEQRNITNQIAKAEVNLEREPFGVVVLIVPWNYPLLIASWKAAQALAAGNTVILKPSSLTPLSALELGKIAQEAGLPEGVFNVVVGSGEAVGKMLCESKDVDMISFTGSNQVGRKILNYSSVNVKKTIMELGGKSASIILEDADLESAVNGSLCSIFLNQGQMCTAMSRIFVQDKIYDKFIQDFVDKAKRIKIGRQDDFETQIGPLASRAQLEKVSNYVEKAKKEGAKVLCGGKAPEDQKLAKGFFFEPTVITGVIPQMSIFKEEIFGPVVIIGKFSDIEEAIDLANTSDFALAACIWGSDAAKIKEISHRINAGAIWINTYGMFFNEAPFGGFKQSGFGKELGREGFLEYSRLKNIIIDKTENAKPLVNYWYGL